jgi:N-acetylglucosamine-6-phosphate deacetylase
MLLISNAIVYTPDSVIEGGSVLVEEGRITAVLRSEESPPPGRYRIVDAKGLSLTPGFIDLQLNGGFGHDFTADPARIWDVAAHLPRYGVTAFLPTIITSPLATTQAAQAVLEAGPPAEFAGSHPVGLHLEGPFLNPAKKGAHNPAYLQRPSQEWASAWSSEAYVRLVTLAPELPGALPLIRTLTRAGVTVSAGHSLATYAEAIESFEAGVRYGTHLFNAMPPLHHREPGLVGALLADERLTVGIIPDGIHVHPALVKMAWEVCGVRLNPVTDAMAALGMKPDTYQLGEQEVFVDQATARLGDGTLAGSILSMDAALRNLIRCSGSTLQDALPAVTSVPARLIGLEDHRGQIAPGYDADLVLLTPDGAVTATMVGGAFIYETETFTQTDKG